MVVKSASSGVRTILLPQMLLISSTSSHSGTHFLPKYTTCSLQGASVKKALITSLCCRLWVKNYPQSLLVKHRTCDWKVASSNSSRSDGRIFFSWVNFLYWLLFDALSTSCYHCGMQKTLVILPKVQVTGYTPKHVYTLDLVKFEWADYAVQA